MIALWHRLPDHFEQQLAAIAGLVSAYHFDDGHDDVRRAADALERLELRGVFFVISGCIGDAGFATASQLRDLLDRGHEIGNHTRTHPWMTQIRPPARRIEIASAQAELADITGGPPRRFAWPHGAHDAACDRLAAQFRFEEVRDISDVVRNAARKTVTQVLELVTAG
jgi:peptidoglycan/xylan/chitin deacetylase (PgdA/CDA1 family)